LTHVCESIHRTWSKFLLLSIGSLVVANVVVLVAVGSGNRAKQLELEGKVYLAVGQ